MKKYKQPSGFAPGIYLDMPNDAYQDDPALSRSGMVDILDDPHIFWVKSSMNQNRKKKKITDPMKMGMWAELLLLEKDNFHKQYKVSGTDFKSKRQVIPRYQWDEVNESVRRVRSVPEADAYFRNGIPQVSIFWVDPVSGMRLRIRIDYLRIFGGIDYKRIKAIHGNALGWIITDHGYDMQDRLYRTGIAVAKEGLRTGKMKIFGEYDKTWFSNFCRDQRSLFTFCFQQSMAPFPFVIQSLDDEILQQSQVMIDDAIGIYKHHIEKYGANEWPAGRVMPEPFSIYHLPKRFFARGAHQL